MKKGTIIINLGLILLLGITVASEYSRRGYFAFGGEWLIPVAVNAILLIRQNEKEQTR